jgi:hypothetical protein
MKPADWTAQDDIDAEREEFAAMKTTAYFTHNNAYDAIVIDTTRQYFHILGTTLADFLADDPGQFAHDWDGTPLDDGEEVSDYGDVLAYREQDGPVVVVEPERWAERLRFHHITA